MPERITGGRIGPAGTYVEEGVMLRKMMIALAALTFVGTMVASDNVDARAFSGGGIHGGGVRGRVVGGGFRGAGIRGGFVGRPAFAPRNRVVVRNRFVRNRFAFAGIPFAVGAGLVGASCWRWVPTRWGWRQAWVCG
jgi:hypothetical protein